MKNQCLKCGKSCEGEYCFQHKPRKALSKGKLAQTAPVFRENYTFALHSFFLELWRKRQHLSEVSGVKLIGEPLSTYFHHILPKNKYPEAEFDEENIVFLTALEHETVEADMYRYEEINSRRIKLLEKYETTKQRKEE